MIATEKIMVSKMLKSAGLSGFRIHRVEREIPGGQITALLMVNGHALTAVLRDANLYSLTLGWV